MRAKLGEVIKGGGAEGGEGGRMWGPLEVTRIIGGHWGTLAAKLAVLSLCQELELRRHLN